MSVAGLRGQVGSLGGGVCRVNATISINFGFIGNQLQIWHFGPKKVGIVGAF